MQTKLIASSNSQDTLMDLISEYFCGANISLSEDGTVLNSKGGAIKGVRWTLVKRRYRFERVSQ